MCVCGMSEKKVNLAKADQNVTKKEVFITRQEWNNIPEAVGGGREKKNWK